MLNFFKLFVLLFSSFVFANNLDAPISINSDKQQANLIEGYVKFSGNVKIKQALFHVEAEEVTVYLNVKQEISRIWAKGDKVHLTHTLSDGGVLESWSLDVYYDVETDEMELLGNVLIKQKNNQIKADKVVYNLSSELIQAGGSSKLNSKESSRIETIFIPSSGN